VTGPGPEPAQPVESGSPGSTGVSVDRITYVGPNGDLFTVNPDGSGQLKLTGGAQVKAGPAGAFMAQSLGVNDFYAWPTWSPDGSKVAASRVQVSGGQAEVSVEILDAATGRSTTAYQNEVPSLVADGAPHYLYWSPDSKWLAFLAATQSGLTLFVADIDTLAEPVAVESGAPLYFQWSGDSKSIMIHVGEELKRVGQPFGPTSETLVAATQGFRVPALSPDGKTLAYVGAGESGESLLLAQAQTPEQGRRALDIGVLSAFAWSPDGRQLAVADQEDTRAPFFRRLRVFTAKGERPKVVAEGQIMAFYWAPREDKIAWVSLDADERQFVWWAAQVPEGEPRQLFRFQPSGDVMIMLSFFDQYAYSHSPWSPDGSRLVVAGVRGLPLGRRNGQSPTGDQIFILDADGVAAPRELAPGTLAFWSWN